MKNIIEIKDLYKEYQLGVFGSGTLYRDLQSLWANLRGKEDPNSLLGIEKNSPLSKKNNTKKIFALNNINISIPEGQILGIIGRNGAGKSTLLKILSRITAPTKGNINIYGRVASLLEVGTGFHPELTGRENIYLNGSINGMSIKETKMKLDEIANFAGIDELLDTPVKRYSSGMIVRLGFAVAAHLESQILIIDEVLSVGDVHFRKKAELKLQEIIKKSGKTILYVSHNMDSVKKLCNKAIYLNSGSLIKYGEVSSVLEDYMTNSGDFLYKKEIKLIKKSDKKSQVLNYYIENSQSIKDFEIDRTKPFTINIIYELNEDNLNHFVGFNIHTNINHNSIQPDTPVLQWSERHFIKYKNGKEVIIKSRGKYHVKINIPGYILTQGGYYFNIYIKNQFNFVEILENKFFFRLYDINSSHNFKEGISAGLIAMPLNWEEKKI